MNRREGRSGPVQPGPCVEADGQDQESPERYLLVERVEAEKVETVADKGNEQYSDH